MPSQGEGGKAGLQPDPACGDRKRRRGGTRLRERRHLSQFLTQLAQDDSRERISVTDLLVLLEGRATAGLLLLFGFPNMLPMPPGTSGILGLPLVYLSLQMMLGRPPWLPRFIAERSLPRADFAAIIRRSTPFLARAERLLAPRIAALSSPVALRLAGALCFGLSLVLLLPIPLGNMLPAAAICVFALGVLERDGLWMIAGCLLAVLSFAVVSGVVWAFLRGLALLLG
ncbi:exopolysaccharide biosynthesis protein [Paracoccus thiocyanatus]|uniref:ABC transporter permease n=1 Tax=Paracoccus thiocyanatus TaxID=34006 RepID=A0A3D8P7B5_9RHOB|nr:exopolysaccharide biosynthesis protein [Paracoccus thiocyanatus]RDW11946.1 ABC transporter permease [Paracoccus thiocyanatus]